MNRYKFFFLDDSGHVFKPQGHLLRDDLDALTTARGLCNKHPIEVWQGARQVVRVKAGDQPLNASDSQSL